MSFVLCFIGLLTFLYVLPLFLYLTDECSVKVEVAVPLEADIVSEEEGDEDPGDDNVS